MTSGFPAYDSTPALHLVELFSRHCNQCAFLRFCCQIVIQRWQTRILNSMKLEFSRSNSIYLIRYLFAKYIYNCVSTENRDRASLSSTDLRPIFRCHVGPKFLNGFWGIQRSFKCLNRQQKMFKLIVIYCFAWLIATCFNKWSVMNNFLFEKIFVCLFFLR